MHDEGTILGGIVAAELVVARTPDTVCAVPCLSAYPNGFSFRFDVILRDEDPSLEEAIQTLWWLDARSRREPHRLYIEVTVDGRTHTVPYRDQSRGEPVMEPRRGAGGLRGWQQEYWISQLPQGERITFTCDWQAKGISDANAHLESAAVRAAARRAVLLWS